MTTDLFIISGRSGSGKTTALKTLEDNGYKCLDNLPVNLLETLIEENLKRSDSKSNAYAVCADSRSESIELLPEVLEASSRRGVNVTLIYLDAQSPTLVKRFSETRRKHPLTSEEIDLREAVNLEATYLELSLIHI